MKRFRPAKKVLPFRATRDCWQNLSLVTHHIAMTSITSYVDSIHRRQLIQLWTTVFGYEAAHNSPGLAIDKKLATQDGLFFVALAEGCVAGSILAGYDGHRGWLYSVAVDPAYRKKGLGSALVRHAEAALIERGCMKINLQIIGGNEAVAAFYESLGYTVEPRVSMGKRITQNISVASDDNAQSTNRADALPSTPKSTSI